jgi:uncharacterized protein (TIGR02001 family)
MNFKSKLVLALLATSSAAFAQTAPAAAAPEVTYNIGVVSQYRYRGQAQSNGDAALQGGVDYANANGFYAGVWGSTIKWIEKTAQQNFTGGTEIDIYGGYKFEASGVGFDVGVLRYEYPNNSYAAGGSGNGFANANTNEVYGAATYGVTTLKYSHSLSDLFGNYNSKGSTYVDLSATFDLGNGYTMVPHVGHQAIKNYASYSYTDYSLTLNKDLGDGLSASVAAIAISGGEGVAASATGYKPLKDAIVVGVKYSF